MQCSLDKHGACFCYQEGDLFSWEEVALVSVLLALVSPLEEATQQKAAVHGVPVQELLELQESVLTLEMLELVSQLLLELFHDFLQVDLKATKKVIIGLHQKDAEQNQMLEDVLAILDAQSKVEHRPPSVLRVRLSSCPDL